MGDETHSLPRLSRSVVDVQDFNGLLFDSIGGNVRERSKSQFSSAFFPAWTAAMRRVLQSEEAFVNFGDCNARYVRMVFNQIAESLPNPKRPLASSEAASLEQFLDSLVHFLFFNPFSAVCLLNSLANGRAKRSVIFRQAQSGILDQFFGRESLAAGYLLQSLFLFGGEMDLHVF